MNLYVKAVGSDAVAAMQALDRVLCNGLQRIWLWTDLRLLYNDENKHFPRAEGCVSG